MDNVTIKSPNPDEIWEMWKRKYAKREKLLEKHYKVKGAVVKLDDITAAEYVKEVIKEAALYYEIETKIKPSTAKARTEKVTWKKLEKTRFYEFGGRVDKTQWKGKEEVPFYNTISSVQCQKCAGKGYTPKKCGNCGGTGKYNLAIDVFNEKGDKIRRDFAVKCPECFGEGTLRERCSECDGVGYLYRYEIIPVPFKSVSETEPVLLTSTKVSGMEKEMGKEIQKALQTVGGIIIRNPDKELDQKFVEANLGYFNKNIKNMLKQAQKNLKGVSKDPDRSIKGPIYLFPLISLLCETRKGKKFYVYSIGSADKFVVFGRI